MNGDTNGHSTSPGDADGPLAIVASGQDDGLSVMDCVNDFWQEYLWLQPRDEQVFRANETVPAVVVLPKCLAENGDLSLRIQMYYKSKSTKYAERGAKVAAFQLKLGSKVVLEPWVWKESYIQMEMDGFWLAENASCNEQGAILHTEGQGQQTCGHQGWHIRFSGLPGASYKLLAVVLDEHHEEVALPQLANATALFAVLNQAYH